MVKSWVVGCGWVAPGIILSSPGTGVFSISHFPFSQSPVPNHSPQSQSQSLDNPDFLYLDLSTSYCE